MKYLTTGQVEANEAGYIALTSAIIISVFLMVIALTISSSSFSNRFSILDSEIKEKSSALAEGCVQVALLRLAQNSAYAGNEDVSIDGKTCSILPIETGIGQKIIKTRAAVQGFNTNFKVVVNSSDLSIISWDELPTI